MVDLVTMRAGERDYGVPVDAFVEARPWTPLALLPRAPAWVRGLMDVRGAVVPVHDLAARLGGAPAEPDRHATLVVVRSGARMVGLLVAEASDGVEQAVPATEAPEADGLVSGTAFIGGRTIRILAPGAFF